MVRHSVEESDFHRYTSLITTLSSLASVQSIERFGNPPTELRVSLRDDVRGPVVLSLGFDAVGRLTSASVRSMKLLSS